MRTLLTIAISITITGCAALTVPMHSFTPTTKSDGEKGWRMVYQGYTPEIIEEYLIIEVGKNHICPNGWAKTTERVERGFTILEGKCR
jgi:hypothetical protein